MMKTFRNICILIVALAFIDLAGAIHGWTASLNHNTAQISNAVACHGDSQAINAIAVSDLLKRFK